MNMKKSGFLLIDKPQGMTSHDVVDFLRKITGVKKIGHSGTLDPFATGLLIIGIGREATKKLSNFLKMDKEYIAQVRLGAVSSTFDIEGEIREKEISNPPSLQEVELALKSFIGEISQKPPIFSAKKIKGKKLYEIAREGGRVVIPVKKVRIYNIDILDYSWPYLKIKTRVSSGTYIRSLANDLGEALNCGAYLEQLRRIKIGDFDVKKSQRLEDLTPENWERFLQDL